LERMRETNDLTRLKRKWWIDKAQCPENGAAFEGIRMNVRQVNLYNLYSVCVVASRLVCKYNLGTSIHPGCDSNRDAHHIHSRISLLWMLCIKTE
jgi:hypothetical protein